MSAGNSRVIAGITTSVDGYVTGPDDGPEHGLGIGGERLHNWVMGGPWTYEGEHAFAMSPEDHAFYDELFPHAEEAVAYIDKFDYSELLPEDVANLRTLLYSLITVSLAVELWRQPRVKHSAHTILTRMS